MIAANESLCSVFMKTVFFADSVDQQLRQYSILRRILFFSRGNDNGKPSFCVASLSSSLIMIGITRGNYSVPVLLTDRLICESERNNFTIRSQENVTNM